MIDSKIDAAALALREKLQGHNRLTAWTETPNARKKKWWELARVASDAASTAPPTLEQALKLPEIAAMVNALRLWKLYNDSDDMGRMNIMLDYENALQATKISLATIEKAGAPADTFSVYHAEKVGTVPPSDCL